MPKRSDAELRITSNIDADKRVKELREELAALEKDIKSQSSAKVIRSGYIQSFKDARTSVKDMSSELKSAKSELARLQQVAKQTKNQKLELGLSGQIPKVKTLTKEIEKLSKVELASPEQKERLNELWATYNKKLGEASAKQKKVVDNLTNKLSSAQSKLSNVGTRSAAAVEKSNVALDKRRQKLQEHIQALDGTAKAERELKRARDQSQGKGVQAFRQSIKEQEAIGRQALQTRLKNYKALKQLRAEYLRTGGSVSQWNAIQSRTKGNVEKTTSAIKKQTSAQANLAKSGKSSLSLFRQLKTQIVGLTSAYVGLHGVASGVSSVFDTQNNVLAAENKFAVGFGGDNDKARREMEFAKVAAKELGQNVETAIGEYSKFVAASNQLGFTQGELRKVFVATTKAIAVNKLANEDAKGVFRALTQIMSKNQVMAEELRLQLGDRLPGAVSIMAAGLGVTTEKLAKMMEQGEVTGAALLSFADEMDKRFSPQLAKALDSPRVKLNQFQNTLFELREKLANSGFIDELTAQLERFGNILDRPETVEGIRAIANAIVLMARGAVFLAENIDLVVAALATFAGIKAVGAIGSLSKGFIALTGGTKKWGSALKGVVALAPRLLAFLGPVGAAIAAVVAAGTSLYGAYKLMNDEGDEAVTIGNEHQAVIERAAKTMAQYEKAVAKTGKTIAELANQQVELKKTTLSEEKETAKKLEGIIETKIKELELHKKALEAAQANLNKGGSGAALDALDIGGGVGISNDLGKASEAKANIEKINAELKTNRKELKHVNFLIQKTTSEIAEAEREAVIDGLSKITPLTAAAKSAYEKMAKAADERNKKLAKLRSESLADELALLDKETEARKAAMKAQVELRKTFIEEANQRLVDNAKQKNPLGDAGIKNLENRIKQAKEEVNKLAEAEKSLGQLAVFDKQETSARYLRERVSEVNEQFRLMTSEQISLNNSNIFDGLRNEVDKVNLTESVKIKLQFEIDSNQLSTVQSLIDSKIGSLENSLSGKEGDNLSARINSIKDAYGLALGQIQAIETRSDVAAEKKQVLLTETQNNQQLAIRNQFEQRLNEILSERDRALQSNENLRATSGRSDVEAENETFRIDEDASKKIEQLQAQAKAMLPAELFDDFIAGIENAEASLTSLEKKQLELAKSINRDLTQGFFDAFQSFASGAESAREAFSKFAADFLKQIAQMILQQTILNNMGGGGVGGLVSSFIGAPTAHGGGMIDGGLRKTSVPSWVFNVAPRYHSGGIAGFLPNEVPAVLKKGEEVLTETDPRHRNNYMGKEETGVAIYNSFDPADIAEQALATPAGKKAVINIVKTHKKLL